MNGWKYKSADEWMNGWGYKSADEWNECRNEK